MKPSNESDRGELEPDAPRGARPVLRGRGAGDNTPLPGEERTLFTTAEAAAMLGIAHETVKAQIRLGRLAAERINPRLNMVTRAAIEAYRRDHLGREGRPKGAKNKPKAPTTRAAAHHAIDEGRTEPPRERE